MIDNQQRLRAQELAKQNTEEAVTRGTCPPQEAATYYAKAEEAWRDHFERHNEYNKADQHID
jgi:hypothetical protein